MDTKAQNNTVVLSLGLAVALGISAYYRMQLGTTAGHMDEYDYLFIGKTLLSGNNWPSHTYVFGWDLSWLLFAWADVSFGGLTGARLVSAFFGILSLLGMYVFAYSIWHCKKTALISTLLLGMEASHIYISTIATYDIISFTAFLFSLPAIVTVCRGTSNQVLLTLVSSILLCIAILTKYSVVLYLPFIAILVLWRAPLSALLGFCAIATMLGSYLLIHYEQLKVLYTVQILSAHKPNANTFDIAYRIINQHAALILLAITSLVYALIIINYRAFKNRATANQVNGNYEFLTRKNNHTIGLIVSLLIASTPLCIYHVVGTNVISLHKHLVYTSLFLIPIIARFMQNLLNHPLQGYSAECLLLVSFVFFGYYNSSILSVMRSSYPDMSSIAAYTTHMTENDSILSEDPYLFRYALIDKGDQTRIKETNWIDNNLDGIFEHRDVKQAVWGRKFDYVFLNDQLHKTLNKKLRKMLAHRGYVALVDNHYVVNTLSGQKRSGRLSLYAKPQTTKSAMNEE